MDYQRMDVEFRGGTEICRAWLYRPFSRGNARGPCIVMAHGLGGTREAGLEPYAQKFAQAGYLVLLFDYRHFGDSDGQPRQLFSVGRQLGDWAAAIKYARSLDEVDEHRVALWGTSFSGGHVIVAAARDGRVAAVAAQCPMMDALAASLNVVRYGGVGTFLKLGAAGMVDQLRAMLRLAPFYIPLVAPHGALAAMSIQDSASGYGAIVPLHWQNRICARYVLTVAAYRPIAYAGRLRCPALIQVCMNDSLAPPGAAIATARKIGAAAELKQYECGHFDIYVGRYFERASDEQLAFFNRVLSNQETS
jgi:uncharacterized protein